MCVVGGLNDGLGRQGYGVGVGGAHDTTDMAAGMGGVPKRFIGTVKVTCGFPCFTSWDPSVSCAAAVATAADGLNTEHAAVLGLHNIGKVSMVSVCARACVAMRDESGFDTQCTQTLPVKFPRILDGIEVA